MRIGFYAPLKAPSHPVPSGDRKMARMLIAALRGNGHSVDVYSELRSFARGPETPGLAVLQDIAAAEVARLGERWAALEARPDLLFTYHLYYKAPDLLGPALAARLDRPYVTAEASIALRRARGPWAEHQALVEAAVRAASLNICFTARDRAGLVGTARSGTLVDLPPFTDPPSPVLPRPRTTGAIALVTVAMMRPGNKLESYRCLAAALGRLAEADWHLTIVGDGEARPAVEAAFAGLPPDRLRWVGALPVEAVPAELAHGDIFVWPGINEPYGLGYLEAQAAGLPVVGIDNAGVPEVVVDGVTGVLTDMGPDSFAAGIARLVADPALRRRLGESAARFVCNERSLPAAARRLDAMLAPFTPERRTR